MRRFTMFVASLVAGVLIATVMPAMASAVTVPKPLFGQHVAQIRKVAPKTLTRLGAVRLWDSGVAWRQIEIADNRYQWGALDRAVFNARKAGATEVLYVLGSTPVWAASNPRSKGALYGRGSNTHPRTNKLYTDYLTALVKRYGNRITSYQVWNEANLHEFYLGTPTQLARLTKEAKATLTRLKSRARLVAASTTVRAKGPVGKFGKAYGPAMRKVGWPVDVVSAHFYPPSTEGPATRVAYIKVIRKYYKKYGAGSKPLWDTEMSYGDTRKFMKTKKKSYTGATAATYVARTYIDSMRYGVSRVFWYGWDIHMLGTDMTTRDRRGAVTAGGRAYLATYDWMVGKSWLGCSTKSKVTTCTLRASNGKLSRIMWTSKKSATIKVPAGSVRQGYLNRAVRPVKPGQKVAITSQPVLFR